MKKLVFFLTFFWTVFSVGTKAQDASSIGKEASYRNGSLQQKGAQLSSAASEPHAYRLYYRWDEVEIDTTYLRNPDNIREIAERLHSAARIDSIAIYSYASPEGTFEHNANLARLRAAAARDFIMENSNPENGLKRENIFLHPVPENWAGLRDAVDKSYHRWDRAKVLETLDNATISDATRKWRLQQLDGGVSWKWMRIHLMPELRLATWICVWVPADEPSESIGDTENGTPAEDAQKDTKEEAREEIPEVSQEDTAEEAPAEEPIDSTGVTAVPEPETEDEPDLLPEPDTTASTERYRRTIAAVKTNLLYDAVTAVNFSVEIPVGKRVSIQYEHICPWWKGGPNGNKYCMQALSLGGEARWWFGMPAKRSNALSGSRRQRDVLAGHHIGLYGDGGKFDIQAGRKFGLYQTHFWDAGISYGYSLPLGKLVNMEFSVGVGYMRMDYRKYTPAPDWSVLLEDSDGRGRMHWFGPTKARISLTVPIIVKTRRIPR